MQWPTLAILCNCFPFAFGEDDYREQLFFHPIEGGLVSSHFRFTQSIDIDEDFDLNHFDFGTFPRPIVELVHENNIDELRVAFSKGRWYYGEWGQAPVSASSMGIEVNAYFPSANTGQWKKLTSTLSGLFCASINLIDDHTTIIPQIPVISYETWKYGGAPNITRTHLRGMLPGEFVCTENLTPWSKLLPCVTNAGLGMLLNPLKIFDSSFHQFDVNVKVHCRDGDCLKRRINLTQNLLVVHDLKRYQESIHWTLLSLLERQVTRLCPVAKSTIVSFPKVKNNPDPSMFPNEEGVELPLMIFHNQEIVNKNFGVGERKDFPLKKSPIDVSRRFSGVGQEHGGLVVTWTNRHQDKDLEITHTELLPYYMRLFTSQMTFTPSTVKISKFLFSPGMARERSSQLELVLTIPAGRSVKLVIPFEKEFLRYTDYPFDPNRGFDVVGATIDYSDPITSGPCRIVTPKLLLTMPTPDFTMPFNVITLTSTLIVLFYGTFFNLTFRRFYLGPTKIQMFRDTLKRFLQGILERIKSFS